MASYLSRVTKRAWRDTLHDCGFKNMRSATMKIVWTAITVAVALYLGGAAALIEQFGKFWSFLIVLASFFALVLIWNFLTAPANIQRETDAEIDSLKSRLERKDMREAAMARLWGLRAEGTQLRNEAVNDYGVWKANFEGWHERVLKEAETVSKNLRAWLNTLDRVRPGPSRLPPAANSEHNILRSSLSEILLRLEEFLQAEMLHRDIISSE